MTTLTADTELRPDHCTHKLPSSCRLTALPICCACQDRRPHASSYRKYIDGVGFVLHGTRHERYCWQCRVFWDNRVAASGLSQAQTRIPDAPDQTVFLSKWYDWHRGFRIIRHEDGREERQAMVGESLADMEPGYLPRTTHELRSNLPPEGEREALLHQQQQQSTSTRPTNQPDTFDMTTVAEEDRLFEDLDLDTYTSVAELPADTSNAASNSLTEQSTLQESNGPVTDQGHQRINSQQLELEQHLQQTSSSLGQSDESAQSLGDCVRSISQTTARVRDGLLRISQNLQDTPGGREIIQDLRDGLEEFTTSLSRIPAIMGDPSRRDAPGRRFLGDNPRPAFMDYYGVGQGQDAFPPHALELPNFRQYSHPRPVNTPPYARPSAISTNPPTPGPVAVNGASRTFTTEYHPHSATNINPSAGLSTNTPNPPAPQPASSNGSFRTFAAEYHPHSNLNNSLPPDMPSLFQPSATPSLDQQINDVRARLQALRAFCENGMYDPRQGGENLAAAQAEVVRQQRLLRRLELAQRSQTVLGTREDVQREDYTSPINNMFTNYRQQHEERQRQRENASSVPNTTTSTNTSTLSTPGPHYPAMGQVPGTTSQTYQNMMQAQHYRTAANEGARASRGPPATRQAFEAGRPIADLERDVEALRARSVAASARIASARNARPSLTHADEYMAMLLAEGGDYMAIQDRMANVRSRMRQNQEQAEPAPSLDREGTTRPGPAVDEDKWIKMECKICFDQVATVALLPCGHCVMCRWCADECIKTHRSDTTAALPGVTCPVCRRKVKNRVNIYGGEEGKKEVRKEEEKEATSAEGVAAEETEEEL